MHVLRLGIIVRNLKRPCGKYTDFESNTFILLRTYWF